MALTTMCKFNGIYNESKLSASQSQTLK